MPQHKLCTADIVRLSLDQFFALSQMHRHSRGATVDFRQPDRHYAHGDLTGSTTGSSSAKATTVIRTVADTRSGKQTLAVGFEGHVCSLPSHPGSVANALAYNAFVRDHPIKPLCNFTDRVACFTVFPDTVAMATPSPPGVNSYRPWPLAVAPIAGDGLPAPYVWCLVLSNSHPEHEMTAAVRVMSPDGHTWIRTFTERDRPLVVRADSWTLVKMCEAHVLAPMRVVVEWYRMRTVNGLGATDPSSTEMALQLDRFPSVFMDLYVVPKEQVANLEHLRVARARCIKSLWLTADDCKRNQLLVPGNDNVLDKLDATRFFFGHIARFRKARTFPLSPPLCLVQFRTVSDSRHPSPRLIHPQFAAIHTLHQQA
ncbi:hypothetical protein BCR44DRAFT_363010 [Catenaria anguillulae PL171]|uniref:Uncharacterized protein n=1 Tax=Catenaria anguillulae PL171 TaxID=765915 RepID=A0A1Y2HHE4_9FUNG|nr:hypothetical protein BCR44DRAFT_363010 [Catenaria anguillulae PL171]